MATLWPHRLCQPRRLAAHVTARGRQGRRQGRVQLKLMPVTVGLDADGQATPALLKKLQALGKGADAGRGRLKRQQDGKAEALFLRQRGRRRDADSGLQKALDEAIAKLPIPKVMTLPAGNRLRHAGLEQRAASCAPRTAWWRCTAAPWCPVKALGLHGWPHHPRPPF